jgi:CDGSH-type Zn-finger protein
VEDNLYQAQIKENNNNSYKIVVTKNGPYLVYGNLPLAKDIVISSRLGVAEEWKKGSMIHTPEVYSICRCGNTKKPPFFDGTHTTIKFNGKESTVHRKFLHEQSLTKGPELILHDILDLCIGARFCHKGGGVWKLTQHSDEPEKKELAIKEACYCPSGRLIQYDKDTNEPIEPHHEPSLGITIDLATKTTGPLWVKGYIPIISSEGTTYEIRNRVTLCRCGRSKIKPFCDGMHISIRFRDIWEDED